MAHTIQTSLDWSAVESALLRQSSGLMYQMNLRSMIRNIQVSITELSRAEIEMRRGNSNNVPKLLAKINEEIDMVEGYILVAALIGKA